MITPQEIPLAALEDILESVLPIIFIVLYAVGQLLSSKKNKQKQGKRPQLPQVPQHGNQRPPGAGQQAGGGQVGMEEVLRKEVDEFLRRAQGKPPRKELNPREVDAGRQQDTPRRLVPAQERTAPDRQRQQDRSKQVGLEQQRLAKQIARPPVKVRGMGVAEHVAEHISDSSRQISQHAENLGEELSLTDERVEDRLHKKFDHHVGRLQHQEIEKVEVTVDLSAEIADMLSKPAGMRQLIIANEILRRPFD